MRRKFLIWMAIFIIALICGISGTTHKNDFLIFIGSLLIVGLLVYPSVLMLRVILRRMFRSYKQRKEIQEEKFKEMSIKTPKEMREEKLKEKLVETEPSSQKMAVDSSQKMKAETKEEVAKTRPAFNKKQLISGLVSLTVVIGIIILIFKTWKIILLGLGFIVSLLLISMLFGALSWFERAATWVLMFGGVILLFIPVGLLIELVRQFGKELSIEAAGAITIIMGLPFAFLARYGLLFKGLKSLYRYITGKD